MGLDLAYIEGQTPIDEEEKEGLLIQTITTKAELDEFEQLNIEESLQWVMGKKFKTKQVFTENLYVTCTNVCMEIYGFGQGLLEKRIKT